MPRMMRLPSPASDYRLEWANQYTRMLEAENNALWNAITNIQVSATALTIGSTTISGGTSTRVLYDNAGLLGEYPIATGMATWWGTPSSANLKATVTDETGSGALVFATSPTLTTPLLGTPTSGNLVNCSGYTVTNVAGLGTGVGAFLATPSSANLATAVTDETGSGALVFATSPALVTPALGTPTSGDLTNCTGFPGATSGNATTYMAANTALGSGGTWTALCNTGSIGANGQTWLIIGKMYALDTAGQAFIGASIFNGTSRIDSDDVVNPAANQTICITLARVVALTGATTFTLQGSGSTATCSAQKTASLTNSAATTATSISAVRIA